MSGVSRPTSAPNVVRNASTIWRFFASRSDSASSMILLRGWAADDLHEAFRIYIFCESRANRISTQIEISLGCAGRLIEWKPDARARNHSARDCIFARFGKRD